MQTNQTEAQQMAAALLAYLNQLEILPVNIALERAEERPAAVMTLREEPAYRRYDLAGGYKAQFPFAVSYCLTPDGQAQRIAAKQIVNQTFIRCQNRRKRHVGIHPQIHDRKQLL